MNNKLPVIISIIRPVAHHISIYICGAHIFLCMIVVWMVLHIRPIQPVIWCFRDSHYCCWMGLSAITDEIAGNNIYQINQGKGRNKEELRHAITTLLPDTVRDIARTVIDVLSPWSPAMWVLVTTVLHGIAIICSTVLHRGLRQINSGG